MRVPAPRRNLLAVLAAFAVLALTVQPARTQTTDPQPASPPPAVDNQEPTAGDVCAEPTEFDDGASSCAVTEPAAEPPPSDPIQANLDAALSLTAFGQLPRQDALYVGLAQYGFSGTGDSRQLVAVGASTTTSRAASAVSRAFGTVRATASPARNGRASADGRRAVERPDRGHAVPRQSSGGSNAPPDGTITSPAGNVTISAGQAVTFASTGTDPDNNLPLTYQWSFGTGGPPGSSAQNPGAVTFPQAGVYVVTLTVVDALGLADPTPATRTITVQGSSGGTNQPPDGTITSPAGNVTISAGQSVTFASTGVDPDNNLPLTYQWNFGTGGPAGSSAQNPGAVTFPNAGVYTVTLTVVDALGAPDPTPATRTITVSSAAGFSLVPQSNWTLVSVNSEETQSLNGSGGNAFDGDPNTSWVTQFTNGGPAPPHEIRIDLGASHELGGFRYLPHQAFQAGRFGEYAFYVSADGTNWGTPVTAGAFPDTNSGAARNVFFVPKTGRYVRFVALSEVHGGVYDLAALGELDVFALTGTNSAPTAAIVTPAQDVTVRAGTALRLSGTGSDPETPLTFRWTVGGAGIADLSGPEPGYVEFATPGTFPVTLTVTDALARSTAVTRTVTVLGGTPACSEPSIVLTSPRSLHLQTTNTLQLTAEACVVSGQGVRFVVDGVGTTDFTAPFAASAQVARGEHFVEAYIVDGSNNWVAGVATYDRATRVAYGDYYVATGDGMTIGFGDDKPDDDNSQDGRSLLGGYTSVLADGLTAARGYPVHVALDAISGGASADGAAAIGAVLARHPAAQYVIVLWGHNDAEDAVPSGLGLMPPNAGYAGSYKANIQAIITAVQAAGKTPLLAKSPPVLPLNNPADLLIQQYNQVLDELAAQNSLPVPPADFYSHFANLTATHYQDNILLNGLGYESMGQVWIQILD